MAQTPVPEAERPRSDAEKAADALRRWSYHWQAFAVVMGLLTLVLGLFACETWWLAAAAFWISGVAALVGGFWLSCYSNGAAEVLLQLDGMRREIVGPRGGADPRGGGSGESGDEQA